MIPLLILEYSDNLSSFNNLIIARMANACPICFRIILEGDEVDILLKNIHCKTIIGKYKWWKSQYCFSCLQAARKLLWRHFLSLLLECDSICAANMLASLKYYDIPLRITDNMRVDGMPIYALYYHGEMLSSRLETGMSDMGLEIFKEKIKNAKNAMELEIGKGKQTHEAAHAVLNDLFQNMKM